MYVVYKTHYYCLTEETDVKIIAICKNKKKAKKIAKENDAEYREAPYYG